MDIRLKTGMIIRRGPVYMVAKIIGTSEYRWSRSPWDAWTTRSLEKAETIRQIVGGEIYLFNPISGDLREMKS